MGKMLDSTLSWIFEKMAKAYVHRTGNSLSDAKVPVVQEVDGKPYFNLSSIGSADLAKLSGANGIDGTIAEAISGLRLKSLGFSKHTDDYGNANLTTNLPEGTFPVFLDIDSPSYAAWMFVHVDYKNIYIRVFQNTFNLDPYAGDISGTIYYLSNPS